MCHNKELINSTNRSKNHWQELFEAYAAEAKATGKPQLMLTAAVSAGKGTIDAGYEIAEIARYNFVQLKS